ncbi:hypothetical protein CDD83_7301 [Cordyceps sp. RAO-2017]|nr:hypothetical protein CDD83_7301 [Cordyceps sp. RAO-2017]
MKLSAALLTAAAGLAASRPLGNTINLDPTRPEEGFQPGTDPKPDRPFKVGLGANHVEVPKTSVPTLGPGVDTGEVPTRDIRTGEKAPFNVDGVTVDRVRGGIADISTPPKKQQQ